jgi:hypothetical protein
MKSHVFQAVLVALLLAGCATSNKSQKAEHESVYDQPLNSPGAKFGAMPPVVQRTVLAEAGLAEIVDTVRDTSSGRVVYKIYFRDKDVYPPLYVAPDGSVLSADLTVVVSAAHGTRIQRADVPAKVLKTIPERARKAGVAASFTSSTSRTRLTIRSSSSRQTAPPWTNRRSLTPDAQFFELARG